MRPLVNNLRLMSALLFVFGAVANLVLLLGNPQVYQGFAVDALFSLYQDKWHAWVLPNLTGWIGLVIGLEILIGLLLLGSGQAVRIGLVLGAGFMLLLVPYWWYGAGLLNLLFAGVLIWLLRYEYRLNLIAFLLRRSQDE